MTLGGRTPGNQARAQEFIVCFSTATDVEEQGMSVAAHPHANMSVWVSLHTAHTLLFCVIDTVITQATFLLTLL